MTCPKEEIEEYAAVALKLYLNTPETPSKISSNDRQIALGLHARGIPLTIVESAFLLASVRRLGRLPDMPPLSPIRSLAYFLPVVEELLVNPISDGYLDHLRRKVQLLSKKRIVA